MFLDYAENTVQLLTNIVALLVCLFRYITYSKKSWAYATIIFLSSLMSSYYWTAYLLIMGDMPVVSNLFSYLGWNIAYLVLLLLILHLKTRAEKRYFHPLMLLPIPLNIWQLTFYLPYGGKLNSIYQVAVMTAVACFSLQSILWYWKNRRSGAQKPYVAVAGLLIALTEFGMWTSSSVDWPVESLYNLYYVFSFLFSGTTLYLVWAVDRTNRRQMTAESGWVDKKIQTMLKIAYFAVVLICCIGGLGLGAWMRNVMATGAQTSAYDTIPVVLFVISLFVVAFAVAIIFVVNFGEKVAENNELREATRIAEHANEVKSEFLANMSHEIRTPINAVLGMNEMILRKSLQSRDKPPRDREAIRGVFTEIGHYAGNIESAGNSLLSIINDILDVSKIEAGRMEIVETDYRLSELLNDVSNMIILKAREKGLIYRVDVDASLPDGLRGDEARVRQVITNVLNNAVKYTKQGSVLLSVRAESGQTAAVGEPLRLVISVKDTGIGIRREDIGKLFEKFERVDRQTNGSIEGTGLGLAITHSLLDMMHGSIAVESVYGEGSIFTVTLPQTVVSTEPVGNFEEKLLQSLRSDKAYREAFRAPDARILVVDDTSMNLTVVKSLLKNTQIQIDTAISGAETIALCASTCYDLILMDQRMPQMDGTEAMRRIQAQAGGLNRGAPFICLTADAVGGAKERYLSAGFTDYLAKPIDSHALETMLMKYLPQNKLRLGPEDELMDGEKASAKVCGDEFTPLLAAGVDPDVGLEYCRNDADIYRDMLREYARNTDEKLTRLQGHFEAENWKDYGIIVHAVKSASRMIGAVSLSEEAADLEAAADAGNADLIREGHGGIMAGCAALAKAIRDLVGEGEAPAQTVPDDEVILEFMPEDAPPD